MSKILPVARNHHLGRWSVVKGEWSEGEGWNVIKTRTLMNVIAINNCIHKLSE